MNSIAFALVGLGSYLVLAGLVAIYVGIKRAPLGFEDDKGFHWEETPAPAKERTVSAPVVRLAVPVTPRAERVSA